MLRATTEKVTARRLGKNATTRAADAASIKEVDWGVSGSEKWEAKEWAVQSE